MEYSGHRKLLCELSNYQNLILLTSSDTKRTLMHILVYKFRPKRTGFNMYAEYLRQQLTFLALQPWCKRSIKKSPLPYYDRGSLKKRKNLNVKKSIKNCAKQYVDKNDESEVKLMIPGSETRDQRLSRWLI